MTQVMFAGKLYPCFEHIDEIKIYAMNFPDYYHLFKRFYNKKQMFNLFLKPVEDDKEIMEQGIDDFFEGTIDLDIGRPRYFAYASEDAFDWSVTSYKLEDLYTDHVAVEELEEESMEYGDFFVKADDGQVYYLRISLD